MVVVVALAGCAHGLGNVALTGSSIVPAASGSVTLKDAGQANKTLRVRVHHLAKPEKLPREALGSDDAQTAQTYVVWLQPAGSSSPENVGALMPDGNLEGELTTTTSQSRFDVFITPEASATQTVPTGRHVLQASVGP